MSAPPSNAMLISLINSQGKTVEVYDRLMPYMDSRINELTNAVVSLKKENAALTVELDLLKNPAEESEQDNMELM